MLDIPRTGRCLRLKPLQHFKIVKFSSHCTHQFALDRAVVAIEATAKRQGGQPQQHLHTLICPMDRAVFGIAATATRPGGQLRQRLHTLVYGMDMKDFAMAATATYQLGPFLRRLHTTMRSIRRVVSATKPTARYANGLHQPPLCKK